MTPRQPASKHGANPGWMCRARGKGGRRVSSVFVLSVPPLPRLRARAPARAGRCVLTLLRPAGARLRQGGPPARAQPRVDRSRAAVAVALRRAPPGHARGRAAARARPDAARRGPSARIGTRRRNALPQARHGESDPLLQGPRGGRGVREGARARSDHARVLIDGQPRERGRGPRSRRGHRSRRPLSRESGAREADQRQPSTARRSTPSTAPTTTAAGSRSSSPSSSTGRSSTSAFARTTPRARRRSPSR